MTTDTFTPDDPRSAASVRATLARAEAAQAAAVHAASAALARYHKAAGQGFFGDAGALPRVTAARKEVDRLSAIVMRLRSAVFEALEAEQAVRAAERWREAAEVENAERVARERKRAWERGDEVPQPVAENDPQPATALLMLPAPAPSSDRGTGLREKVRTWFSGSARTAV